MTEPMEPSAKSYKLGQLLVAPPSGVIVPFAHDNTWMRQQTASYDRLAIAPASNQTQLLIDLSRELQGPFAVLYVLLVSRRSKHLQGRYQSPFPLARRQMEAFFMEFDDYLDGDARHHVWVMELAPDYSANATLVYDKHNIIYAYGPIDRFEASLRAHGLRQGNVGIPYPHVHSFNDEFDDAEDRVLSHWGWDYSPLQEHDDD